MHRSKLQSLFDHLVGAAEQRRRHGEAEHPGGLGVDDQLELGRLHHWQVGWLSALKNAAGIDADLTIRLRNIGIVAHQSADFGDLTVARCHGKRPAPAMRTAVCPVTVVSFWRNLSPGAAAFAVTPHRILPQIARESYREN